MNEVLSTIFCFSGLLILIGLWSFVDDKSNSERTSLDLSQKIFMVLVETFFWTSIFYLIYLNINNVNAFYYTIAGLAAERIIMRGVIIGFICTILWVPIELIKNRYFRKSITKIVTTISIDGPVSSFVRNNEFRLISTLYHPNGCYQTAVFDSYNANKILGYKLSDNHDNALINHVSVVSELKKNDPRDWSSWTTGRAEGEKIIETGSINLGSWDKEKLNSLLTIGNLPLIKE